MLSSELRDKLVYSKNMVLLGKVKDVEIDPNEMRVTHFVLEVDKQIAKDIMGKMIVVRHAKGRVSTQSVESIKDAVILKQQTNELKGTLESM